jgi:hypothetical protein
MCSSVWHARSFRESRAIGAPWSPSPLVGGAGTFVQWTREVRRTPDKEVGPDGSGGGKGRGARDYRFPESPGHHAG